jgi:hypothetical protein
MELVKETERRLIEPVELPEEWRGEIQVGKIEVVSY